MDPEKTGLADREFLKWFLVGVAIAGIAFAVWFGFNKYFNVQGAAVLPPNTAGLGILNPHSELPGWSQSYARTNLAEIDPENRARFLYQNVQDAANWEFKRANETLLVWVRVYPDKEALNESNRFFTSNFAWITSTYLAFGKNGRTGIYRAEGANPPLLLYVEKDNKMLYLTYYNRGDRYDSASIEQDKRFLADLGRTLFDKLDLYVESDKSLNTTANST